MIVRLTRVTSTHQNLRTDEVVGDAMQLPIVGRSFVMMAPPLDPTATVRMVATGPVKALLADGFTTENSHYKLEVLG
jgi:hypothetical protein